MQGQTAVARLEEIYERNTRFLRDRFEAYVNGGAFTTRVRPTMTSNCTWMCPHTTRSATPAGRCRCRPARRPAAGPGTSAAGGRACRVLDESARAELRAAHGELGLGGREVQRNLLGVRRCT